MLTHEVMFDRENIESYAKKHKVCPFEMGLDVSLWADCIICDYNYVFDPNVYLKRFFQDGGKGEYIFLIDEAHNLLERGREMYSAVLYKEDFLEVKKYVKEASTTLAKRLENCNKYMLELKRECEDCVVADSISSLTMSLLRLQSEIEKFLDKDEIIEDKKPVTELYLNVRHFLNMYELASDNYLTYLEHTTDGRFMVKLFCVNPAENLKQCIERGRSGVLFSATLLPIRYYKSLLTEEEDRAVYANSPFETGNRCILAATDVSSKYTRRNMKEYEKVAFYIKETAKAKQGNYLVFFPSYEYMEQVYEIFLEKFQEEEIVIKQEQQMTEEDRELFLQEFEQKDRSLLGFCVMGGIFGEGIDLKAERLIGCIIVGTGLPGLSREKELLKSHFQEKGMNGFDYAYRFPGMNKVLQAAGRVIRTAEDKGVVLLLDDRFASYEYKSLYPREWENLQFCNQKNVGNFLKKFWEKL